MTKVFFSLKSLFYSYKVINVVSSSACARTHTRARTRAHTHIHRVCMVFDGRQDGRDTRVRQRDQGPPPIVALGHGTKPRGPGARRASRLYPCPANHGTVGAGRRLPHVVQLWYAPLPRRQHRRLGPAHTCVTRGIDLGDEERSEFQAEDKGAPLPFPARNLRRSPRRSDREDAKRGGGATKSDVAHRV